MRIKLLSTLLLTALLAACGEDSANPSEVLSPGDLPPGEMVFGAHHVMTREGVRTAVVDSDTAFVVENGNRFDMRGVRVQFFAESGAESGTLTSRTGEYTPDEGSFIARDSVVLITESPEGPRRLETEELFYDTRSEQIWSDSAFVLNEAGQISRGRSFRSDVNGENWTATGLVAEDIATGAGAPDF